MKDKLFQKLPASLKEGGAILRSKKKAARSTTLKLADLSGKVPLPGKRMPTKHAKHAKF